MLIKTLIDSHAKSIRSSFNTQKNRLSNISQKATNLKGLLIFFKKIFFFAMKLIETFPGLGKLINRIQRAKMKREIIIGTVIAICILITLYTIFTGS